MVCPFLKVTSEIDTNITTESGTTYTKTVTEDYQKCAKLNCPYYVSAKQHNDFKMPEYCGRCTQER